ncbi:MAG: retropepsin-like aspartic protease [Pseudomonadota bacterium]
MRLTLVVLLGLLALPVVAVDEVTVLGLFADKAMLRIDNVQRLLAVGEQSPEGVKLIAADSEQATIDINGEQRQLKLGTHISSHFAAPKVKTVQVWPDSNGMYSVNGTINGGSVGFLVDTGANTIALNANDAKRLNIDYKGKGEKVLGETASGRSWVYLLNLNTVTVGQIKLYNVEAIVFDGPHPSRALLGLTFLNRIDMSRDGSMMTLEQK